MNYAIILISFQDWLRMNLVTQKKNYRHRSINNLNQFFHSKSKQCSWKSTIALRLLSDMQWNDIGGFFIEIEQNTGL